ncbi:MAG: glycerate kinase [Sedimentisphaerales bacterium]|nr:glycerate kinase [Sedimentisphaerales bacterium]
MKIVIATDSFKGTLTAYEVCSIISEEIKIILSDAFISIKPFADGGEGTARAIISAVGGQWIQKEVMGPLQSMRITAGFAWLPGRMALIEMASASGLELLSADQMNPLITTTYGTGELIQAAKEEGARKILLAVGGSATVDGGVGAAMALGWNFLKENNEPIPLGGRGLEMISRIVPPEMPIRSVDNQLIPFEVLCDVDNPLCGENGAARIYGPQKGATPQMVQRLDRGLAHLARIVREQLNRDIANVPGAGAAGGLAAGAMAFMNATLVSGIDTIINYSNLRNDMKSADWVITGEGCFDRQSLSGKVISGVVKLARQTKTRVGIIAGQVNIPPEEYTKMGIQVAIATKPAGMSLDEALQNSRSLLRLATRHFVKKYLTYYK